MNRTNLELLLAAVRSLHTRRAAEDSGVCYNVEHFLREASQRGEGAGVAAALYYAVVCWPARAPHVNYPVEGGVYEYDRCQHKWERGTHYGDRRWALVDHIERWVMARIAKMDALAIESQGE